MWIVVMAAGTSNERSSLSIVGDHGNCHLLFASMDSSIWQFP